MDSGSPSENEQQPTNAPKSRQELESDVFYDAIDVDKDSQDLKVVEEAKDVKEENDRTQAGI